MDLTDIVPGEQVAVCPSTEPFTVESACGNGWIRSAGALVEVREPQTDSLQVQPFAGNAQGGGGD